MTRSAPSVPSHSSPWMLLLIQIGALYSPAGTLRPSSTVARNRSWTRVSVALSGAVSVTRYRSRPSPDWPTTSTEILLLFCCNAFSFGASEWYGARPSLMDLSAVFSGYVRSFVRRG